MHKGCFGSTLAYAPKSEACKSCPRRDECGAIVTARRPRFLSLLGRFTDTKGETMAFPWLTPAEKKIVREARKRRASE